MRRTTKMRLKLLRRRNIEQPTVDHLRPSLIEGLHLRKPNEKLLQMTEDDKDLDLGSIFPVRGPPGHTRAF